jgi:hypothetical protein
MTQTYIVGLPNEDLSLSRLLVSNERVGWIPRTGVPRVAVVECGGGEVGGWGIDVEGVSGLGKDAESRLECLDIRVGDCGAAGRGDEGGVASEAGGSFFLLKNLPKSFFGPEEVAAGEGSATEATVLGLCRTSNPADETDRADDVGVSARSGVVGRLGY